MGGMVEAFLSVAVTASPLYFNSKTR